MLANQRPSREESLARFMKGASRVMNFTRDMPYTTADRLEERAKDSGDTPFILFEDQRITYAQANGQANLIGRAALSAGLGKGDVVALMMHNRPEFLLVWLGLAKVGIVTALINTSATGRVLTHALDQVQACALIIGSELVDALDTLDEQPTIPVWQQSETAAEHVERADLGDFNAMVAQQSDDQNLPASVREGVVGSDPLYLIFTSGTTGLPKAAKMSHLRFLSAGETMGGVLDFDQDSVFYCVLPLYHGAGGMVVPSSAMAFGVPFVLRRKFSRSGFWPDVKRHKITAVYYIGEIIRYLLAEPPHESDADNSLCKIAGAGLKPDLWQVVMDRFGITGIFEGLGSTESNYGITNVDNVPGSVGRIPYPEHSNVRVIKWDHDADDHVCDENGIPVLAGPGEVGELVGEVLGGNSPAGFFEGYTSEQATEAKLLRDLFKPGDIWFRSGDLVRFDEDDYFYFVDRVGDTYRWKGENVSTQEVEAVLTGFAGPEVINIYGVQIPGTEGRAGMAALTFPQGAEFDPQAFYQFVSGNLATYAMPVFVRLSSAADMTTTFKLKKRSLQNQGYDPALTDGDALFVLNQDAENYLPLTPENLAKCAIAPFEAEQEQ